MGRRRSSESATACAVPPMISCGSCFFCKQELFSLCDNGNPDAALAEALWGHSPCGIFGYSHLLGGYAGSHAETCACPTPTPAR
jgi:threonine dehydrogenase-like Zn-dependent dehydrogenase